MSEAEATPDESRPHPLREIAQPFVDAARAPRALWGNNLQYFLEGFLYFGILNYLVIYGVEQVGLDELRAGWVVTYLAAGITLETPPVAELRQLFPSLCPAGDTPGRS